MSPAVSVRGLGRNYGSVRALMDLSLDLEAGRLHAVVGENGAGKSTLLSLLAGLLAPSAGSIEIGGARLGGSAAAHRLGVGLLRQRGSLLPNLTVAENFALATVGLGRIDAESLGREVGRALSGVPALGSEMVGDLAGGVRQQVELARLLWSGRRTLLLDEPTAVLGESDAQALLGRLRELASEGATVIFSSHRLDEVLDHADSIHILRRGRLMLSGSSSRIGRDELLAAMFGDDSAASRDPGAGAGDAAAAPALELRGLVCTGGGAAIDLRIAKGEIVGVVGLAGNGQERLVAALAGLQPCAAGSILVDGRRVPPGGRPRSLGLRCLPQDAVGVAGIESMRVAENLSLHAHRRGGWLCDWASLRAAGASLLEREGIGSRMIDWPLALLSGGNQRRALLARELDEQGSVLVAHNPEAGLDHRAVSGLVRRLGEARDSGQGVLVFAEELDFLDQIAGRILAMADGQLTELDRGVWRKQAGALLSAPRR